MKYDLMHKDTLVAELDIDSWGEIKRIISVADAEHFPYGTVPRGKSLDSTGLRRWWANRRIPLTRDDFRNIIGKVLPENAPSSKLLLSCFGFSLSDCYWIRPTGEQIAFGELNFFENGFSYDLGDALLGLGDEAPLTLMSPDATSEGNLKKRWKIIDGKRVLLKGGTSPHHYEVFNEVIASAVMACLNIPHVEYRIIEDNGEIFCSCEDFVHYSQDFVTAYMLHEGNKKHNDESEYQYMIRLYRTAGIPNPETVLGRMFLVDYLLGNEDRHLNNFGLLRDAKTLQFMGPAPIFDTGSCLGYDKTDDELARAQDTPWKPFATRSAKTPLDLVPASVVAACPISSVTRVIASTCESFPVPLPKSRIDAILRFIQRRAGEVIQRFGVVSGVEHSSLNETQEAVLRYIRSTGGQLHLATNLCSVFGFSRITAVRNLETLVSKGFLRRVGAKKAGHWEVVE